MKNYAQRVIRRSYNDIWNNYISKYVVEEDRAALSQEYSSLFKIDANTRKMTLFRTDGVFFDPEVLDKLLAIGDYEVILS